jgi:hypothetical protein
MWDTWVWWSNAHKHKTASKDGKLDFSDGELDYPI